MRPEENQVLGADLDRPVVRVEGRLPHVGAGLEPKVKTAPPADGGRDDAVERDDVEEFTQDVGKVLFGHRRRQAHAQDIRRGPNGAVGGEVERHFEPARRPPVEPARRRAAARGAVIGTVEMIPERPHVPVDRGCHDGDGGGRPSPWAGELAQALTVGDSDHDLVARPIELGGERVAEADADQRARHEAGQVRPQGGVRGHADGREQETERSAHGVFSVGAEPLHPFGPLRPCPPQSTAGQVSLSSSAALARLAFNLAARARARGWSAGSSTRLILPLTVGSSGRPPFHAIRAASAAAGSSLMR